MPTIAELKQLYPNLAGYEDREVVDIYAQTFGMDGRTAAGALGVQINEPGFGTTVNRSAGQMAKGVGEVYGDISGQRDNAVSRYADDVIYRNPSGINSLGDIVDQPGLALAEGVGNAVTFLGPQLLARGAGLGLQAYGAARGLQTAQMAGRALNSIPAQAALAGLPSVGEIGDKQRVAGEEDLLAKYAGAGAVGAIENLGGIQRLVGIGRNAPVDIASQFGKTPLRTVGKVAARSALEEGAEELVQTPIEQVAGFQDPLTAESIDETLLGGAMGTIGGLVGLPVAITRGMQHSAQIEGLARRMDRREEVNLLQDDFPQQGSLNLPVDGGESLGMSAVRNPYDVGGYVSQLARGEQFSVDAPQNELFGQNESPMEYTPAAAPVVTQEPVDPVLEKLRESAPSAFRAKGDLRMQAQKAYKAYNAFTQNEILQAIDELSAGPSAAWRVPMLQAILAQRQGAQNAEATQVDAASSVGGRPVAGGSAVDAQGGPGVGGGVRAPAGDLARRSEPGAPVGATNVADASLAPAPQIAQAVEAIQEGPQLPKVQKVVYDHIRTALQDGRSDDVIDSEGVLQYARIGEATGVARGSVKMAVNGLMKRLAAAQGVSVTDLKASLQEMGAQSRRTTVAETPVMPGDAPQLQPQVTEALGPDDTSMGVINTVGGSQVETYEDPEATAMAAAEANPVVEQRQAEARATREVWKQQVLSQPEVADAAQDWDDMRTDGAPAFESLDDDTKIEWLEVFVNLKEGGISLEEADAAQRRIERGLGDQWSSPDVVEDRDAGAQESEPELAGPADAGERQGDDRVDEAPGESVPANPLESRVERLRELIGEKQSARLDKLIGRLQEGDVDVGRFAEELQALEEQAFPPEQGGKGIQYSKDSETAGTTVDVIAAALRPLFSGASGLDRKVTIVQTADELSEIAETQSVDVDARTQAFVTDGRAYLIADNIAAGRELAVFLHEVGVHLGMKGLIGAQNLDAMAKQVRTWAAQGGGTLEQQIAAKALARVENALDSGDAFDAMEGREELVAYFVEEAVNAGVSPTRGQGPMTAWFRRLWAAVKSALRKFGLGRVDQLTAQNIVDLAYGAAKLEIDGTYHGTAASFRRFDHRYMSTGEGAQAFGWGSYLAQRPGIAKGYFEADVARKTTGGSLRMANGHPITEPQLIRDLYEIRDSGAELSLDMLNRVRNDYMSALRKMTERGRLSDRDTLEYALTELEDAIEVGGIMYTPRNQPEGAMHRVDVNATDEELLDWDETLSEQSELVRKVLGDRVSKGRGRWFDADGREVSPMNRLKAAADPQWAESMGWKRVQDEDKGASTLTGEDLYRMLRREHGSSKAASEYLDSLGVKGIKFLDSQSRNRRRHRMHVGPFKYAGLTSNFSIITTDASTGETTGVSTFSTEASMREAWERDKDIYEKDNAATRTRNIVIFNDKNIVRPVTYVGADRERVKFSKAGAVTDAVVEAMPREVSPQIKYVRTQLREAFRAGSNFLRFTEDIVRSAAGLLPSAQTWYDQLARRTQVQMGHKARVDEIGTRFDQLSRHDFKATWSLIHDMTSQAQWGYQPTWRDDVEIDPVMEERYNALSPTAQRLLDEVFQFGAQTIKETQEILDQILDSEYADALAAATTPKQRARVEKQFKDHRDVMGRQLTALDGPYAPMRRVGSHVVVAKSQAYVDAEEAGEPLFELRQDEAHYRVEFFDSLADAEQRADVLARDYDDVDAAIREEGVQRNALPFEAFDKLRREIQAEGKEGAEEAGTTLKKLAGLVNELYLTSLAETSARKSELRRENIAGMDPDAMYRAFLSKGEADAHYIGVLKNGRSVAQSFAQMRNEANKAGPRRHERRLMFNELARRYDQSVQFDPSPLVGKLLNFSSIWMLLTKPAYFFYNATQPLMLTQPALAAKHGYKRSFDAMLTSYKELMHLKTFGSLTPINLHTLPADVRDAVIELRDMGRIDITITQDLGDRIHGARGKVGRGMQFAERTLKAMAQKVEMTNRVVTAVAAYRLAKEKGSNHDQAIKYASDIIYDTHGDYSGMNAPRLMNQNAAMRVITQFRKFQFIQIGQLVRIARDAMAGKTVGERWALSRALRYTLAHHAVLAGAMGLPAANVIATVFAITGGDDEPRELEYMARQAIGDPFLANLLLRGIPAAVFDTDISNNIGMGQTFSILPFADTSFGERGGYEKLVTAATGPLIGGFGLQAWSAMGAFKGGDYYKGLEGVLPSGLRAATRSMREALGGVENLRGDTLVEPDDITLLASMTKALGFRTQTDALRQLTRRTAYQFDKFFDERTGQMKADYVDAYEEGDAAAMRALRDDWLALQEVRREAGFKVQPLSNLLKAPRDQAKREQNTAGGVQFNTTNEGFVKSAR